MHPSMAFVVFFPIKICRRDCSVTILIWHSDCPLLPSGHTARHLPKKMAALGGYYFLFFNRSDWDFPVRVFLIWLLELNLPSPMSWQMCSLLCIDALHLEGQVRWCKQCLCTALSRVFIFYSRAERPALIDPIFDAEPDGEPNQHRVSVPHQLSHAQPQRHCVQLTNPYPNQQWHHHREPDCNPTPALAQHVPLANLLSSMLAFPAHFCFAAGNIFFNNQFFVC